MPVIPAFAGMTTRPNRPYAIPGLTLHLSLRFGGAKRRRQLAVWERVMR